MKKYLLTKHFQSPKEGKIIETNVDSDDFKDVDKFLKALVREKTITKEESEEYDSVYYEQYIESVMKSP